MLMVNKLYQRFGQVTHRASVELLKKIQEHGAIVVGAGGVMGAKISSTFPRASVPVNMQDVNKQVLEKAQTEVIETFEKGVKKRKLSKEQAELIQRQNLVRHLIAFQDGGKIPFDKTNQTKETVDRFLDKNLSSEQKTAYKDAMMVLEAVPEILPLKQDFFKFFEQALNSDHAILATNTSSLKIDDIGAKVSNPERVIGFHYFLPAHVNPLLEIIAGTKTSPEVVLGMYELAIAMGKKPIICFKDSPGAIANRILVGVLNEAAKIYDDGLGNPDEIDKIFLETFYREQIKVQTQSAKNQFKAAPKLSFFKDEEGLYKQIINAEKNKDLNKKKQLLEEAIGKLRQKTIYASVVENLQPLGSFFKASPCVSKVKTLAKEQIKKLTEYLNDLNKQFCLESYGFPEPQNKKSSQDKKMIHKRLVGAYIAVSQGIYNEGLGTVQDIELACKEGFKWNIGPFELMQSLSNQEVTNLITIANAGLSESTGIAKAETYTINEDDVSGIQVTIQDSIGFITLGKLHIQNLQSVQNSLSPEMLKAISNALKELQENNVKAIIFKSQGGGPFCSGADLEYIESLNWETEKIIEYLDFGKKVMNEIANCKVPTVSVIDSAAVGGGAELALACDYRIMTDLSYIAFPEVGLGIIPLWGGTERLPQVVGKELAKRLICTATLKNVGLKLPGKLAYDAGFADAYVLQSKLSEFLCELYDGKANLNIFKKPLKKANYEKRDYSPEVSKKFQLTRSFKHKFRWFTNYGAHLAEDLIDNSHDPVYARKTNTTKTSRKIITQGMKVARWYIQPFIKAAQNKSLAPIFERFGLL